MLSSKKFPTYDKKRERKQLFGCPLRSGKGKIAPYLRWLLLYAKALSSWYNTCYFPVYGYRFRGGCYIETKKLTVWKNTQCSVATKRCNTPRTPGSTNSITHESDEGAVWSKMRPLVAHVLLSASLLNICTTGKGQLTLVWRYEVFLVKCVQKKELVSFRSTAQHGPRENVPCEQEHRHFSPHLKGAQVRW